MDKHEILMVLTDKWCDWEASYAIAVMNSYTDFKVKTIAADNTPKVSMGGIKASVDCTISDYQNLDNLAMVILPGGLTWGKNDYSEIADFIKHIRELKIPIAAICGATTFLGKYGFLNDIKHTGDGLEALKEQKEYTGEALYIHRQVVADNKVITANETAGVQFAYEIFKLLEVDTPEEIEEWYDKFKNGAVL